MTETAFVEKIRQVPAKPSVKRGPGSIGLPAQSHESQTAQTHILEREEWVSHKVTKMIRRMVRVLSLEILN